MQYSILASILVAGASASAITKRDVPAELKCGVAGDANLADCNMLLNDDATWDASYTTDKTCTYTNLLADQIDYTAFNIACYNACCVYVALSDDRNGEFSIGMSKEDARMYAQQVVAGCQSQEKGLVNGNGGNVNGRVCISDTAGCSDCFNDSGEAPLKK